MGSRTAVGKPRRSTEVKSRGALTSELKGICGFVGWYPLDFTGGLGCVAALLVVPIAMLGDVRELALLL